MHLVFVASLLSPAVQGTDAMYNFVLKLNLATREGKALFMRKWAIGRIANGEPITPREGWKFLQSLGIDVPKVFVMRVYVRGDLGCPMSATAHPKSQREGWCVYPGQQSPWNTFVRRWVGCEPLCFAVQLA